MPPLPIVHPSLLLQVADGLPPDLVEPLTRDLKAVLEFEPLRQALLSITAAHPEGARIRARLRSFAFAAPPTYSQPPPDYSDPYYEPAVAPPPAFSPPTHTRHAAPPSSDSAAIAALSSQVAWLASSLQSGPGTPSAALVFDSGAYLREEDWRQAWDAPTVRDLVAQLRARLVGNIHTAVGTMAATATIDTLVHVLNFARAIPTDRDARFTSVVWPVIRNALAFSLVADDAEANSSTIDIRRFTTDAYSDLHILVPWSRDMLDRVIKARRKAAPRQAREPAPRRDRAFGGADRTGSEPPPARTKAIPRGRRRSKTPKRSA